MKTKIIYISGGEKFEMSEIRAAFDEVRNAMGLDNNTILFGVPVDSDDALQKTQDNESITVVADDIVPTDDVLPTVTESILPEIANEIEPEIIEITPEITVIAENTQDAEETEIIELNVVDEISDDNAPEQIEPDSTVVPILSVLGGQESENTPEDEPKAIQSESEAQVDNQPEIKNDVVAEKISLDDVADDEEPVITSEKTLEQLLESMTPLREDTPPEHSNVSDFITPDDQDDTDATLAQLASEFAQNEDKITPNTKNETTGKIGKLKNILPFKKAKRDDSGLMGDLFGWAGIAANDEDFSIPGFFTQNAKKQGA